MYPDGRVASFITEHFIPVKIHIKEQPETFTRFGAQWTPTLVMLDPDGAERHRFEGFLPAQDFRAQLALGLAHAAFKREEWLEAERLYRSVERELPDTDAAPEAQYWAGVARYKATGDAAALKDTAERFKTRYPDSTWAKKASVWA